MKRRAILSIILNAAIVILVAVGMIMVFTIRISGPLLDFGLLVLRYFTIDSNLLMAVASLIYIVFDILLLRKRIEKIPTWLHYFKHMGTVGVALTCLTVIFFLAPTMAVNSKDFLAYFTLFASYNLIFHLLVPVLAIVVFLFFEKEAILSFKSTFIGIIPMVIYGAFYVAMTLTHMENGVPMKGYDWYGFIAGGVIFAPISLAAMILATYAISFLLYLSDKKIGRR